LATFPTRSGCQTDTSATYQRHLLTAPTASQAIRGVLGKFADLPQEAEEEIQGLDEARFLSNLFNWRGKSNA
jgi:hypothetical protein